MPRKRPHTVKRGMVICIIIWLPLWSLTNNDAAAQVFWQRTNLPFSGEVNALVSTSNGAVLAGTTGGGVFRSTDNGKNWTTKNNGLNNLEVKALAINSAGELLAGTADGVYKSINNAESWTKLIGGINVNALAINSSGEIFAGMFPKWIYRSGPNGDNWVLLNIGLPDSMISSLAINSSGSIFAGTFLDGVFRSTNNGNTWSAVKNGLLGSDVRSLAINSKGQIVATTFLGVFISVDDGNSWARTMSGLDQDAEKAFHGITVNSIGHIFVGALYEGKVFRSTNDGAQWMEVSSGMPETGVRCFCIDPEGYLFAGTDDVGVFRSLYSTTSFAVFMDIAAQAGVADAGFGRGVTFGDIDNDDDLDIYVSNEEPDPPNRLYVNNGQGQFIDMTGKAGVQSDVDGQGVAFGDFDNDGDLDLFVASFGTRNSLYRNNGDNTFTDIAGEAKVDDPGGYGARAGIWGDVDNDGWLDLYVVNQNAPNRLFHNNHNGTFNDIACKAGLCVSGDNAGFSDQGASFADIDNDGDLDLYVAGGGGGIRDLLFRNKGNLTFIEIGAEANVDNDEGPGNGVAFGDIDNDGDLDLYVTNGPGFPNRLYRNDGSGIFSEIGTAAGVADNGFGHGVTFADVENDGDLDLFLTNTSGEQNHLYLNDGRGFFTRVDTVAGLGGTASSLGTAFGDIDTDGDLDLYVVISGGANRLYRNEGNSNKYLFVKTVGTISNRAGIGAKVRVVCNGLSQIREVSGGAGYLSQESLPVEFGLGKATIVDSVFVYWPSGVIQDTTNVSINQVITLEEKANFTEIGAMSGTNENGGSYGIAWGDYDNDGDQDLYVALFRGGSNLLKNRGNCIFDKVGNEVGIVDDEIGGSIVWGDYDNDGDLDLYFVKDSGPNRLYKNNGDGSFEEVGGQAGVADLGQGIAAVWGDCNNDGYLDLYMVNQNHPNRLYVNNKNGTFDEKGEQAGVNYSDFSRGVAWGDYDNDGDLDLYLAVDGAANRLYRNNGDCTFQNVAGSAGVATQGDSYGVAWGDYDNDGDLDLFVANHNQPNQLFRNNGNGTFAEVGRDAGINYNGLSNAIAWADFDNDGDLDLYVANADSQANLLYSNNGDGTFSEIGRSSGVNNRGYGTCAAWADCDNDGDLDLYVANDSFENRLYRNDVGNGNHFLHIRTVGVKSNRDGIGTRARIVTGRLSQIREVNGGSGLQSQDSLPVEFGLGQTSIVDSVIIRWPGGVKQILTKVPADTFLTVTESPNPRPSSPENLQPTAGDRQITLTWNANTELDFLRYRIYGGTSPHPTTKVDSVDGSSNTSKTIENLTNGVIHFFRLTAVDSALQESGFSDEVSAVPSKAPTIITNSPTSLGSTSAMLSGAVNPNGLSTKVVFQYGLSTSYGKQIDAKESPIEGTVQVPISASIIGLLAGTTYHYQVVATNNAGKTDGVDQTFDTYPTSFSLNTSVSFPSRGNASDYNATEYRIIGLPGASNELVKNFLSGEQNKDWQVYWDNGAPNDYLAAFDGSSTFQFWVGRAFWIIKKGTLSISRIAASKPLNASQEIELPLHSGWNLITNPFTSAIPWSRIQTRNNVTDPLWAFDGSFSKSDTFKVYAGYYFFNTTNLDTLKIPYSAYFSSSPSSSQATSTPEWQVHVRLHSGGLSSEIASFGISSKASAGLDRLDYRKPRAITSMPSVFFHRPTWDTKYPTFATDIRLEFEESESWEFEVRVIPRQPMRLTFTNIKRIPTQFEVYLIDESRAQSVNLRGDSLYHFTPAAELMKFKVVVGIKERIQEQLSSLAIPIEFALGPNYPNPFNPTTTIPLAVPVASEIKLKIYNLLGEEVKTLYEGTIEAGRYWFNWDGRNDAGSIVATGIYLYRLSVNGGTTLSKKMVLVR